MKKIYLIGENIKQSLSPKIHKYIYEQMKLDADYDIYDIADKSQINKIMDKVLNNDIYGLNITTPYKSYVFDKVKLMSKKAQKIGSINCIDTNLKGYNTDCYGFMKMISRNNINLANKNIHILGSGGASKAILYALNVIGYNSIRSYNRQNINQIIDLDLNNNDIVINCTPEHFINDSKDFFNMFIMKKFTWIDLLYTKLSTNNYNIIQENHSKLYLNGIDMLIYQAMASINIWFRKDIEKNVDFNNLKLSIKR